MTDDWSRNPNRAAGPESAVFCYFSFVLRPRFYYRNCTPRVAAGKAKQYLDLEWYQKHWTHQEKSICSDSLEGWVPSQDFLNILYGSRQGKAIFGSRGCQKHWKNKSKNTIFSDSLEGVGSQPRLSEYCVLCGFLVFHCFYLAAVSAIFSLILCLSVCFASSVYRSQSLNAATTNILGMKSKNI